MVVTVLTAGGFVSVATSDKTPTQLDLVTCNEGEVWPKVITCLKLNKLQAQALREGLGQLIRGLD